MAGASWPGLGAWVRGAAKRLPVRRLRLARLRRKADALLLDWRAPLAAGAAGLDFATARAAVTPSAPRVLIATTVGGNLATLQFDALIAAALTLRGARVEFLLCDAALPACMMAQHDWYPDRRRFVANGPKKDLCTVCHPVGERYLKPFGLPIHRLSTLLDKGDHPVVDAAVRGVMPADATGWRFADLPAGEHALAGTLRFFARSDLDGVAQGAEVFRAYLRAACLAAIAAGRLAERALPDVVLAHHGIYVPQGLWVAAAQRQGRRVVTWNPGYRRGCFILSEGDTYHRTMISESPSLWKHRRLTEGEEARLTRYLDDRRRGADDWISFGSGREDAFAGSLRSLGLDPGKPTILLLTSVNWDARLHYDSNAFSDQLAWVDRSLELFRHRPDLNLVARIHPAELTGNIRSEQKMADHIAARHPGLPAHIAIVGPDNPMNTYALAEGANCALIYSTKTGIELAARGIPVVVAGEAWIRGKGFSIDASSPEDYDRIVAALPQAARLSHDKQRLARLYADHFFFGRMIALPGFVPRQGWPPYRVDLTDLSSLAPGADANLDLVCAQILSGGPFVNAHRADA